MSHQPSLTSSASTPYLIRRWERIGAPGRRLVHHFQREEEAVELFLALLRQKRSRGYGLRPHAGRETVY
ncbi:WGR domain-containing protein [Neorhizobium sp. 2083]|uniref:WGR domain-containing protein n=1 Tax=Neorhizobium sp. 2083 TaxID=2817762 RepID=UPI00286C6931|nr:WGR domain-containing protein [Neorhizobium sp. 2083]